MTSPAKVTSFYHCLRQLDRFNLLSPKEGQGCHSGAADNTGVLEEQDGKVALYQLTAWSLCSNVGLCNWNNAVTADTRLLQIIIIGIPQTGLLLLLRLDRIHLVGTTQQMGAVSFHLFHKPARTSVESTLMREISSTVRGWLITGNRPVCVQLTTIATAFVGTKLSVETLLPSGGRGSFLPCLANLCHLLYTPVYRRVEKKM